MAPSDYIKWIEKISNVLNGQKFKLDLGELTNHNVCGLASWYNGHAKKLSEELLKLKSKVLASLKTLQKHVNLSDKNMTKP